MDEPTTTLDDEARLQHTLAVLTATSGCSRVGESKYTSPDINRMDVHALVDDGENAEMIRRSGSSVFDTKLKMAIELRRRVVHGQHQRHGHGEAREAGLLHAALVQRRPLRQPLEEVPVHIGGTVDARTRFEPSRTEASSDLAGRDERRALGRAEASDSLQAR